MIMPKPIPALFAAALYSAALACAAPAAAQDAPAPGLPAPSLDDFPITQTTPLRCGIAFAVVEGWQNAQAEREKSWPAMAEVGGREFFVRAAAQLMDARGLDRDDLTAIVEAEVDSHLADDGAAVDAMMPACLELLAAADFGDNPQ